MCFPNELKGIEEMEVKNYRKDLRDLAKSARFCFNYNGQPITMSINCNVPLEFAKEIYINYFKRFNGISSYFRSQKKSMWDNGYILISNITGLRSYIYDHSILKNIEKRKNSMGTEFWDLYRNAKDSNEVIENVPPIVLKEVIKRFADGLPLTEITTRYDYKNRKGKDIELKHIIINIETVITYVFKHLNKRRASSESQSCNYSSQGTAASMTKIAAIRYFNHLIQDDLIFKVLIPNDVHDRKICRG